MANQSVRLKEEQLRREEDKLREIEYRVQREIQLKRQELSAKEDSLKVLEARLGMFRVLSPRRMARCAVGHGSWVPPPCSMISFMDPGRASMLPRAIAAIQILFARPPYR